jgi:shikimate dehydrogenase
MDPATLPGHCAVFDIIAARRTEFMQAAAARGLKVVDGTAMIKHQLPLQIAFWRGGPIRVGKWCCRRQPMA